MKLGLLGGLTICWNGPGILRDLVAKLYYQSAGKARAGRFPGRSAQSRQLATERAGLNAFTILVWETFTAYENACGSE